MDLLTNFFIVLILLVFYKKSVKIHTYPSGKYSY